MSIGGDASARERFADVSGPDSKSANQDRPKSLSTGFRVQGPAGATSFDGPAGVGAAPEPEGARLSATSCARSVARSAAYGCQRMATRRTRAATAESANRPIYRGSSSVGAGPSLPSVGICERSGWPSNPCTATKFANEITFFSADSSFLSANAFARYASRLGTLAP